MNMSDVAILKTRNAGIEVMNMKEIIGIAIVIMVVIDLREIKEIKEIREITGIKGITEIKGIEEVIIILQKTKIHIIRREEISKG